MFLWDAGYCYSLCHSQDEELPPNVSTAYYELSELFYKCVSNLHLAGLCEEMGLRIKCIQLGRAREGRGKVIVAAADLCHR